MTQQEIFDKVVHHLFKQGKPATDLGACRYRTQDGLSCAVGCLIPNELYSVEIEHKSVHTLFKKGDDASIAIANFLGEDNKELLSALQMVHDCARQKEDDSFDHTSLKTRLKVVATEFNLSEETLNLY